MHSRRSNVTAKTLLTTTMGLLGVIAALVVWIFQDSRATERSFETEARAAIRETRDKVHALELAITRCCK